MILTDEKGLWNNKKTSINTFVVSHNENISFSYFANIKQTQNFMSTVALNYRFQNYFTLRLDVFCAYTGKVQILIYVTFNF